MNIFLTALAVLPGLVLCIYVFKKDRIEKEPVSLLLLLFSLGMVSCFPAAQAESFLLKIVEMIFIPFGHINSSGSLVVSQTMFYIYNFIRYFFVIALVEELFKFIILHFFTKRNKNFNCLFDGIIYAVFVSLGFAVLENVLYVAQYGLVTAIMRAVLSVPAHMFFAVFMGYYYSFWHIEDKVVMMERKLRQDNVLLSDEDLYTPGKNKLKTILVPILAHGLYDFCCSAGTLIAFVAFVAFVVFMYINCFRKIKKISLADGYSSLYAKGILVRKYPYLEEYIQNVL